jgi:hypothetical protein
MKENNKRIYEDEDKKISQKTFTLYQVVIHTKLLLELILISPISTISPYYPIHITNEILHSYIEAHKKSLVYSFCVPNFI